MTKLRKSEKSLILLSVLTMVASGFAFTTGYDWVLAQFHLEEKNAFNKVAEVVQVQDSARRKEYLSPEFRPIREHQAVFSNDSIITGHESGLIIKFMDGSKIEVAPDTMVQVKARGNSREPEKFHFEITVEKGKVVGTSPLRTIQVKQLSSNTIEVLKPAPTPKEVVVVPVSTLVSNSVQPLAVEIIFEPKNPVELIESADVLVSATPSRTMVLGPQIIDDLAPSLRLPEMNAVVSIDDEGEILFTWSYADASSNFEFQLAEQKEMKEVMISKRTSRNFSKLNAPKPGVYFWRVKDLKTEQSSQVGKFILK